MATEKYAELGGNKAFRRSLAGGSKRSAQFCSAAKSLQTKYLQIFGCILAAKYLQKKYLQIFGCILDAKSLQKKYLQDIISL